MEELIIGMDNPKALPGLEGGGGRIAALRQHEGHLRPPLLEAAQVEGEEIVWGWRGKSEVKSSFFLTSVACFCALSGEV